MINVLLSAMERAQRIIQPQLEDQGDCTHLYEIIILLKALEITRTSLKSCRC